MERNFSFGLQEDFMGQVAFSFGQTFPSSSDHVSLIRILWCKLAAERDSELILIWQQIDGTVAG